MPRKKFYPTDEYPYHVTGRTVNKEWFSIPKEEVWAIFSKYLHHIWIDYDVRIHAFVLMSNHFHMLISTPEANLDKAMNYFMRESSKRIGERAGKVNQVFGGPYHWSVIKNDIYYQHAYKYLYRNPVEAGLCEKVEDYQFSTLKGLLGMDYLHIPVYDTQNVIHNPRAKLEWLNAKYDDESRSAIQAALKRKEFGFAKDPHTGNVHRLENLVL